MWDLTAILLILIILSFYYFYFSLHQENYGYTHSLWHIFIMTSVVFLMASLKDPNYEGNSNNDAEKSTNELSDV